MKLILATENPGKKKELVQLFDSLDLEIETASEAGLTKPFPPEDGETFKENAFIKADFIFSQTGEMSLGDDSGLSVAALDGFPGVKSARWKTGSDEDRCTGLLEKIKESAERKAEFITILCLKTKDLENGRYFTGTLSGTLSQSLKGTEGFGYDPIFIPEGETKTLAELGTDYKNQHSHRAIAAKKLQAFLKQYVLN